MMKGIIVLFFIFMCFWGNAQTYNPANFTVTNKSIGQAQANPTDARSQFYDATNFVMRDYQSTTEVNSYLNLAKYRTGHFLIYIHNGGSLSSGVWTGGTTDIYIYKNGVADGDLIPLFTNTTLSNTGSGFRIVKPISGYDYPLRSLASSNTIIWDSTSNSNSLTGKVDTSLIVTINRLSDTAASIRLAISAGGGGITTLTGDVTASGTGTVAATIANNAVSNAKFRQSAALSVVGRTSNSTGNVADIAAATSGHVLRRNGTTLDFGTIDSVSVPLLHSEAYYNTKYTTIGSDSIYVKAAQDTGTRIFHISGDTLKLSNLVAGTNITLTKNADSSITISATGGSGSPGGSNTQVQFNNSSAFGGDAGLTYNSTTNTLTTDSLIINGVNINRLLRGLNGYNQFAGKDSTVIMAGAAVPTVNPDNTITWVILFPNTGHNTYYVNTVRASNSTGQLHVVFPHVDRIVTWLAVPDDALATKGVFVGGSITLDSAILNITRVCQLGGYGYGDGTNYNTSFTAPYTGGSGSAMTFAYDNSTGTHTISNIPVVGKNDPYSMNVSLATSENWRVVWDFNGLSDYQMKFKIYDNVSNTVITGAPTTNHKWFLSGPVGVCQVNAASNSTGNDMSKNTFVSGSAIIFYGIGEK